MWPPLFPTVVFNLLLTLSATSTACPKFTDWADATTHLNGPLVCAKIYSNGDCNGFPLLFGVNSSVPDLKHTMSIMSLSTAFALIRPGCRLHIWSEANYGGKKVGNFKRTSWHIGDAVKASATCDCMTNTTDILTCKPEAMWSHVKSCDFSRSLRGGSASTRRSSDSASHRLPALSRKRTIADLIGLRFPKSMWKSANTSTSGSSQSSTDNDAYRWFARNVSTLSGHGIVTSPNYPNNYPVNVTQAYILRAQTPSGKIKLRISTFDTEATYDKLLILDGSFGKPLDLLSGDMSSVRSEYKSMGPLMVLLFYTDHSIDRGGWSASFSTFYD